MTREMWDAVRRHALSLPAAAEDFPWGEPVVKVEKRDASPPPWRRGLVHGPMFVWLGARDASSPAIAVKLDASHDQAVAVAGATPTTASGLGQWGWLTVELAAVEFDLACEWVEESYRNVAPKKLAAQLDANRARETTGRAQRPRR